MKGTATLPLRTKLTAWYTLVLAGSLLLFIAGTAFILDVQLFHQLNRFAIEDIETIEGLLYFKADGTLSLNEDYHNHPQSRNVLERLLEVVTPEGRILYRNARLGDDVLGGTPFDREGVAGYSERTFRLKNGDKVLLVSRRHVLGGRQILIRLGYRESEIWLRIRDFLTASFTALPILLALAALLGYHFARRLLSPLAQMATRAEQITAANLEQRLPIANQKDELGHLARAFNNVLDRLETSFEQLHRFTSDASHELRTPLAALRSVGEVGLQKSQTADEYRDIIGSMLEEVTRLTKLVENLLTISRADAGQIELNLSTFSPRQVVEDVVGMVEILAEERNQRLSVTGDQEASVEGDKLLLRQALINIIHNAVKYSPVGGSIDIELRVLADQHVNITVADSGPGIEPEHRARIFDRFYRIDEARTRESGGAGLGLAIARWAVQVQGGEIWVEDRTEGAAFTIGLKTVQAREEAPIRT
jgi:heavy metal sensor kinase